MQTIKRKKYKFKAIQFNDTICSEIQYETREQYLAGKQVQSNKDRGKL